MSNPQQESEENGYKTLIDLMIQLGICATNRADLDKQFYVIRGLLQEASALEASLLKEIDLELKRLDLADSGNYGHEKRRTVFLATVGSKIAKLQGK